jgi:hypothetical protein
MSQPMSTVRVVSSTIGSSVFFVSSGPPRIAQMLGKRNASRFERWRNVQDGKQGAWVPE